jgi:protein phosphatase 1 regulatory subunit 7
MPPTPPKDTKNWSLDSNPPGTTPHLQDQAPHKMPSTKPETPPHISIDEKEAEGHDGELSPKSARSSSGWDGKLRVEKKLEMLNPEAISDPEYSDEEQVLQGEQIEADEGL